MNNEVIVVKQLPIIQEQLKQINAEVTERVNNALRLVCTEETLKSVKDERAALNKDFKYWEDKRKEVKKAILSPYEQFEAAYKENISDIYKKADVELKAKIGSVESELKERKQKEVFSYFEELCEANGLDFVTFDKANINITLSASMKSLKEQAKAFVDRVCDDLALIETQDNRQEILYEYKKNGFNVSGAITAVVNRYKAIEEAKAREAERQARAAAEEKAAEKVETVAPIAPPVEEEKTYTVSFTVTGTRQQMIDLKRFLKENGYNFK